MARLAVKGGTDTLVATPHHWYGSREDAPAAWVREQVARLQAEIEKNHIPLKVVPGLEIKVRADNARQLATGHLGTLGDAGAYALIETPFHYLPPDALDNLRAVQNEGIQVVLAHPERIHEFQRDLSFVHACAAHGMAFQLTTGSLLGRFGPGVQQTAEAILAHAGEWPLVIASDTHDLGQRSPNLMRQARDAAARLIGAELAQDMVDARPRAMISPR